MELYHVLNRGVDKHKIFLNDKDRFRFIHDLFEFNDQNPAGSTYYHFRKNPDIKDKAGRAGRKLLVNIHCFVLMPNHYHLLVSPVAEHGISKFMKKINMGYAKYFNEKYERSGALFQGKYKSVLIKNDRQFLYIPYYIHLNPLDLFAPEWRNRKIHSANKAAEFLESYRWSSHLDYMGKKNFPSVTQRGFFLNYFGGESGYLKNFVREFKNFQLEQKNINLG